ncbi:hypothetical protein CsatA_020593 [Cannabis sativa]
MEKMFTFSNISLYHYINLILLLTLILFITCSFSLNRDFIISIFNFIVSVKSSPLAIFVIFIVFNHLIIMILYNDYHKHYRDCVDEINNLHASFLFPSHKVDEEAKTDDDGRDYYHDDHIDNRNDYNFFYGSDQDSTDFYSDNSTEDVDGDSDDDYDDIELQRRSEKFIERTNLRWREELKNERTSSILGTNYCLV